MSSLLGCVNMTSTAIASNTLPDDGAMALTPEYTVVHAQGQPQAEVYAAFTFEPKKTLVKLRPGDSISVNGVPLQGQVHDNGYFYKASVPVGDKACEFVLQRAGSPPLRHRFELPALNVTELPQSYRFFDVLRLPVRHVPAPAWASDRYDLSIHTAEMRYPLDATTRTAENRYKIARTPDVQDGAVVFKPVLERAPAPGRYRATLHRAQRIVLSEMSDASRTGWATLTTSLEFTLQVK